MANEKSFRVITRGWEVQQRVIGALLLREVLTRYGRNNIGFLWLFVEPMMFTLVITALWTATRSVHGSDIPIVAFAITGYSSVLLWRNMPNRCMRAVIPNVSLLFHRQVKVFDIYIARILLEFLGATTSFVALGLIFWSVGWLTPPEDVLQVLFGWMLLAWFGAALGLLIGALSENVDMVDRLWPPFSYIIFPLSGAAFIADALPEKMREVVLYLPMLNALELLREGYFGSAMIAHYDIGYVVLCNFILTLFALAQVRRVGVEAATE